MADFRNHRRFTLKGIKASITPLSGKLKDPPKTKRSYNIIQRAEKQLLYERITNINSTLETFKEERKRQYLQFKDMLNMLNLHDQDTDLERCILFINKIKDHRHNKMKKRQIHKFNHLFYKKYGHHHNLTTQMQAQNFGNIDQQCTLSRHHNVPSSFSSTSTQASSNPAVPTTSMAPTPSTSADLSMAPSVAPRHPPFNSRDTCQSSNCTSKWVINLSKPPLQQNSYPYPKKDPTLPYPPSTPPIEAYITAVEQASSKLPAQEADEL